MPDEDVMQFKVTLLDVHPPVWRRIQLPGGYTFWGLHVAIQDAMGWQDYHLHKFEVRRENKRAVVVGIPDEEYEAGRQTLPGWDVPVNRYLEKVGQKAKYEYDFGDGWEHELILENVLAQQGACITRAVLTVRERARQRTAAGHMATLVSSRRSLTLATHPTRSFWSGWVVLSTRRRSIYGRLSLTIQMRDGRSHSPSSGAA